MKRIIALIGCALLLINFCGCASRHPAVPAKSLGLAALPPYSGSKARIAVADFDMQAAKATREIGSGLRQMLLAALKDSNRFIIVESPAAGANKQKEEEAGLQQPPADLVISISVAEFEPQVSGGSGGIGGGGGVGSGVLGGLLGTNLNKAHMVLNIRIVATSNSEVLASTRVQGQASDVAAGIKAGEFGSWPLGKGLSAYADTPMEKAIRVTILEAVRYVSQTIPANYYKY